MSTISFPNLFGGLDIRVSRIAFTLFGIEVYWYGLIIGIAFCVAVLLAFRDLKRYKIKEDDLINLLLFAVPIAIIFARLFYVVFLPEESWTFSKILNIRDGGLAIYGAIIGGLLVGAVYAKVKKINFLDLADLAVPYLALAQAIGRWGNFINQEAFGTNTTMPWGMTSLKISNDIVVLNATQGWNLDPNMPVHPTFLYESLWALGLFLVLYFSRKDRRFSGQLFCLYMAGYGFGRMIIEGFRTDSLMMGGFRVSQLLGFVFFIVFGGVVLYIGLRFRKKRKLNDDDKDYETGTSEFSSILSKNKSTTKDEETIKDSSEDNETKNEEKE